VPAITVQNLSYSYRDRVALDVLSFSVSEGEIFGLLGPNGGGKSTLFRILSTLLPVQQGIVTISGFDLVKQQRSVRRELGVTFQSPSLDRKLTVLENLRHQGHLYGIPKAELQPQITANLKALGVSDRASQIVSKLSGGLQRRVEIAKALLHRPRILLLDEPSTGLDPGAVLELWGHLRTLRQEMALTILVSTHLLNEAENCDRLAILHLGRLVAVDTPGGLRRSVGGDCLSIQAHDPACLASLASQIESRFSVSVTQVGELLQIKRETGHDLLRDIMVEFGSSITSVTLGKPTLSDVFVQRTGHSLTAAE
jgi:ABC-2 type transport system ATP-binding protein